MEPYAVSLTTLDKANALQEEAKNAARASDPIKLDRSGKLASSGPGLADPKSQIMGRVGRNFRARYALHQGEIRI